MSARDPRDSMGLRMRIMRDYFPPVPPTKISRAVSRKLCGIFEVLLGAIESDNFSGALKMSDWIAGEIRLAESEEQVREAVRGEVIDMATYDTSSDARWARFTERTMVRDAAKRTGLVESNDDSLSNAD